MDEPIRGQHPTSQFRVIGVAPVGVSLKRVQSEWEGGISVYLADGKHRPVPHRTANSGVRPGRGEQQTDADSCALAHVAAHQQKTRRLSPRASLPFPNVSI